MHSAVPLGVELEQRLYALDATRIDICLSLFPWVRFRREKPAVKMRTRLELRGNIPAFVYTSEGKVTEVKILDSIVPEAEALQGIGRSGMVGVGLLIPETAQQMEWLRRWSEEWVSGVC
jgi:hypothetical protein